MILYPILEQLRDEMPFAQTRWSKGDDVIFPDPRAGICSNVDNFVYLHDLYGTPAEEQIYHELSYLLREYAVQHGVSSVYPVGGKDEYMDRLRQGTLWSNPKRYELLDWLLEHAKHE